MDYLPQMTGQHTSPLSTKGSLMAFIVYAHSASLCALLCVLVCIFVSLYLGKHKINCGCRNALKAFKPLEISCFLTLFYTNTLASTSCIHSHSHIHIHIHSLVSTLSTSSPGQQMPSVVPKQSFQDTFSTTAIVSHHIKIEPDWTDPSCIEEPFKPQEKTCGFAQVFTVSSRNFPNKYTYVYACICVSVYIHIYFYIPRDS